MISDHANPLMPLGGTDSGGQNVYVEHLSRALGNRGIYVDIFTRQDGSSQQTIVNIADRVRVFQIPAGPQVQVPKEKLLPYMPEFVRQCLAWARLERYNVAHAHFFLSGLVACQLQEAIGLPFVMTFHALGKVRRLHQGTADEFPDERFRIEERIVGQADGMVAECPQDLADLVSLYGADPSRIRTIPCGVDPELFHPEMKSTARRLLGIPEEKKVVLQLGRLVPRKGIDNVIEAFSLLVRNEPSYDMLLLIVGGPSEKPDRTTCTEMDRLMRIAEDNKVADKVLFVGRRKPETLRYFYSAADVFVTTPWYEPFGITPLEAMACGTPVIGSRVGGIQYSIQNNATGLLVPPKSPGDLASAIRLLLADPALCQRFSKAGRDRVEKRFTWDIVAREIMELYTSATNSGARPREDVRNVATARILAFPSGKAKRTPSRSDSGNLIVVQKHRRGRGNT